MKSNNIKSNREVVKDLIIKNAVSVLSEKGFSNVSMRSIAKRCDMSATNLYNYFSSKDEIYITILIQGFNQLYSEIGKASVKEEDLFKKAKDMIRAYFDFGIKNRYYYEIMFSNAAPTYKDYIGTKYENLAKTEMDLSNKIIEITKKLLIEVAKYKKIEIDEQFGEIKVVQLWSMLHGLISLFNNQIVDYITSNINLIFDSVVDEYIKSI